MLILPLHKKPTRENFPLVTLILLLVNIAVFSLFQSGDHRIQEQAAQRYIDSGVLSMEWNWFTEWSRDNPDTVVDAEEIDSWFEQAGSNDHADMLRLMAIESEPAFLEQAELGSFAATDSPEYQRWQQARAQLEADRESSFTERYMLHYDQFSPINTLSHMFMHGDIGHLIGNMLFLIALGLLVEGALGSGRFLALYLLSGIGAALACLSLNWGANTGMVGASGAIAGLMGLYAVLYGLRRVRFFYWFFVYFDYVRAPALVLLPIWLTWELLHYLLTAGSNIAYEAHIGGLISGAALGFLATNTGQVNHAFLDEENKLDKDREAIKRAQSELEKLNAAGAKRHLRPLLARHGKDTRLLRMYFGACRLRLDDPEIHSSAKRILQLPGDTPEQRALIMEAFGQYRAACKDRLKISLAGAATLASRLAHWGDAESAQFLIDRLARSPRQVPGLATACRALAERLRVRGHDQSQADHYNALASTLDKRAANESAVKSTP